VSGQGRGGLLQGRSSAKALKQGRSRCDGDKAKHSLVFFGYKADRRRLEPPWSCWGVSGNANISSEQHSGYLQMLT